MHISTFTHQGTRRYQEDAFYTATPIQGVLIALVADGLGGHAHGDLASAEAVMQLKTFVESVDFTKSDLSHDMLVDGAINAFKLAHRNLVAHNDQRATTIACLIVSGNDLSFIQAGDSYCLIQFSNKTGLAASLHETPGGSLVNCIGIDPLQFEVVTFQLNEVLAVALATDGVELDAVVERGLASFKDARDLVEAGMRLYAFRSGNNDNATAILVSRHGPQPVDEDID